MKKLIILFLILALAVPAAALADYSPFLGMTMSEYLAKYNSVPVSLSSPHIKLTSPYTWTDYENYKVAWFSPARDSSVIILLLSKDPDHIRTLDSGLDAIQICTDNNNDLIDLISITARTIEPFTVNLLGVSLGDIRVTQLIRYYYENGCKGTEQSAYQAIDEDENMFLILFMTGGWTIFQVSSKEGTV